MQIAYSSLAAYIWASSLGMLQTEKYSIKSNIRRIETDKKSPWQKRSPVKDIKQSRQLELCKISLLQTHRQ